MNPLAMMNKRTQRAPVNPLDKSTVFSILPKSIVEVKCTLEPGRFEIPSGSYENPSRLVVGPSSWWKDVSPGDEGQPLVEIPTSSILIADSIVRDYCNGILGCNMGDMMPGLFWIPGDISLSILRTTHKGALEAANRNQRNWFNALIKMGDTLWARSQGNPLAISEDMKMAAQEMNIVREWTKNFEHVEMLTCRACGQLNKSSVVVCPNCKVVLNPEEFKKLNLQFAS